jgi:hypothetical protein
MSSSCIEDLGKVVDKLIVDILFLVALELNIVNRGKKKLGCNSCGKTYRSNNDQAFPNENHHPLPK